MAYVVVAAAASADEESLEAGPYQLSFDMGAIGEYVVDVNESALDNGDLSVSIESTDGYAYVLGFLDEEGKFASSDAKKGYLEWVFSDFIEEIREGRVQYYKRTIDGEDAVLGVLKLQSFNLFIAVFSKEIRGQEGSVMVEVGSLFPWGEGTEDLLNSIKVGYSPQESTAYGTPYGTSAGTSGAAEDEVFGDPYGMSRQYDMSKYDRSYGGVDSLRDEIAKRQEGLIEDIADANIRANQSGQV
ncbi:MAG TPA: hypothetical protein PLI05_11785 [Methanotrichaceae archaeon]|nr:hypothetical protein [Methanotrichaceae archaeon]